MKSVKSLLLAVCFLGLTHQVCAAGQAVDDITGSFCSDAGDIYRFISNGTGQNFIKATGTNTDFDWSRTNANDYKLRLSGGKWESVYFNPSYEAGKYPARSIYFRSVWYKRCTG